MTKSSETKDKAKTHDAEDEELTEEQREARSRPEPVVSPPLGNPEPPETTTCAGSGQPFPDSPVPEEQRHPAACPVCGKNFDLEVLDPEAEPEEDLIPEHDDIRLVPEEPMDLEPEPSDEGRRASKR